MSLVQRRLQAGERWIEAAVEADEQRHAGLVDGGEAGAGALEVEVDRLLAEDRLAGPGRGLDEIGVGICRRADNNGGDFRIGERRVAVGHPGADGGGQVLRGGCVHVDHVLEAGPFGRGDVAGVNLPDASGTELRYRDHLKMLSLLSGGAQS